MREGDYLPIIELALREDLGELGDVTSQAVVPDEIGRAHV
jgi:nicotinate-nucleotide pyrophosphorylase